MLDFEVVPTWLYVVLAIALLALAAYLVNTWRVRRAMARKDAAILKARRQDMAKWNALQEERRKQEAGHTPSS